MDLITVGLGLDSKGAVRALAQFTGSAHNAGRATEHFERTTKNLTGALRTLGGYFAVRQLVEYADTWLLINARIRLVTDTQEQAMAVQERLYQISQRTRNTLAATSVLYTRLALGANELGRSQEELLKVTEAVNAGMLVSGATGVEAAQSMRQLAQAFSKGKLDGDEFRTVMEAMPKVAQAIADEMKVTRGELLALAPAGKISANTIIQALLDAHDELIKQAESMPVTVGQAYERMGNAMTRMIGIISMGNNIGSTFGKMIQFVADNLDHLISLLASATAGWLAYRTAVMSVAAWQALVVAAGQIRAFIELASTVRNLAAAMTLLQAASIGTAKVFAMLIALVGGFVVYRKILGDIRADVAKWEEAAAKADLSAKIGAFVPKVDATDLKRIQEIREATEDMIRLAHQRVVMAGTEEEAQKKLAIQFDAINARIEAQRELTGELLRERLAAIDKVEELGREALAIEEAMTRAADELKERIEIIERFSKNIQKSFADVFYDILQRGINSFKDLFRSIKDMFFRMLAEMAAANLMRRFGGTLASALGMLFGGASGVSAANAAAAARQEAQGHMGAAGGPQGIPVVRIEGFTVTAERSLAARMVGILGPALAGFGTGYMLGGMFSNRGAGMLAGAAGGAAAGALAGSAFGPLGAAGGAVVGGLTGAIGGLIGSSNRHRDELRKHREILEANNKRLQELRASIEGSDATRFVRAQAALGTFLDGITARDLFDIITGGGDFAGNFTELKRAAEELGITLFVDGKLVKGALEQLAEALELTLRGMLQFGRNMTDVTMKVEAYNKIFNIEDTPQQRLQDSFAILSEMAPQLIEKFGLAGIDLTTQVGQDMLRKAFQEIYNLIVSGQLTPELLGAFTDKNQLLDAILKTTESLETFRETVTRVTTDFPRPMDIPFYEQKFGKWGLGSTLGTNTAYGDAVPQTWNVSGDVVINSYGDETGEELLNKIERAASRRRSRGGSTLTVTTDTL